jgi:hypothetical protein
MRISLLTFTVAAFFSPSMAASKKPTLVGKTTYSLPQKVVIQDTIEANKLKESEPMLALMKFKYSYIAFGEVIVETYNTNGNIAGEISFHYLQQVGMMGLTDHPTTKTAKLENIHIKKDTLWFLYRFNQYSEQQKGFLTISTGKRILGIPSSAAYKIPCTNKLPGVHSLTANYLALSESNLRGVPEATVISEFCLCLDSVSIDEMQGWETEIRQTKFVADSVISKLVKAAK